MSQRPASAAQLLHAAAGYPAPSGKVLVSMGAPCWWCRLYGDLGVPAEEMIPDTFPQIDRRPSLAGRHVCAACAWTLASFPRFPAWFAAEKLDRYARDGRRCTVIHKGEPTTLLLLRLDDGTVGRWTTAKTAALEKPWADAREALRAAPCDVGPCTYLGAVPLSEIESGPERYFFSYHHLGALHGDGEPEWIPTTDSRKDVLRSWVLSPPDCPHVISIGTGKKHTLIFSEVSLPGAHMVHFQGATFGYRPAALAVLIGSIEALLLAGFGADAIAADNLSPADPLQLQALRRHDPILRTYRGGAMMGLALFLRRPLEDLRAESPAPLILPRWTPRHLAGLEPYPAIRQEIADEEREPVEAQRAGGGDAAPVPPVAVRPAPTPVPDPPRPAPSQLSLFG